MTSNKISNINSKNEQDEDRIPKAEINTNKKSFSLLQFDSSN